MEITTFSKENLNFIKAKNSVGLEITFVDLGASIFSIKYFDEIMTPQVKNIADFKEESVRFGKTIGRVAGRIKDHVYKVDGETYVLSCNEHNNTLHGGHDGIATKKFTQRIFNTTAHTHIVYTYFSKDLESGFPGNALFEVHYIVSEHSAKVKMKLLSYVTKKCPISMTVHTFFNLGDSNLDKLSFKAKCSKYIQPSYEDLVQQEIRDIPPCLDFRKTRKLVDTIDDPLLNKGVIAGYDHYLLFDKPDPEISQMTLSNNRFKLDILTDFEGAVIYSDNGNDTHEVDTSKLNRRRALAIEPQISHLKDPTLRPGDEFDHFITYIFSKK